MIKRTFDVLSSAVGLIILSPLFLIVAIWIKLDSKGAVFFRQIRVGKDNRDFRIFKFRSMREDAHEAGVITMGEKDPRITPCGKFIRKFKIDEFPQLINVFKGDMSIVGPRPQVREHVHKYTPNQMRVLSVKPGITDWGSIKYSNEGRLLINSKDPEDVYNRIIMPDKLRLNLEYIENQSLWLDLKIIFLTFWVILKRKKK